MSIVAVPQVAEARIGHAEKAAVKRINALRAKRGLRALRLDRKLSRAADAHSRDMLRAEFFAHPSSNGASTYDRVRAYRRSRVVGENLAYMPVAGHPSAAAVVRMWRDSAPHLEVMTAPGFRRVGIAKRRGRLFGQKVTVWTADFATRH